MLGRAKTCLLWDSPPSFPSGFAPVPYHRDIQYALHKYSQVESPIQYNALNTFHNETFICYLHTHTEPSSIIVEGFIWDFCIYHIRFCRFIIFSLYCMFFPKINHDCVFRLSWQIFNLTKHTSPAEQLNDQRREKERAKCQMDRDNIWRGRRAEWKKRKGMCIVVW